MPYCHVERTKYPYPYESMLLHAKIIQLENDATVGDVFNNYILCDEGNVILNENFEFVTKKGKYVTLIPLDFIERLVSDRDDLVINGFKQYKDKKNFYSLKGFEITKKGDLGVEIIDKNDQGKVVCRYYYIRE